MTAPVAARESDALVALRGAAGRVPAGDRAPRRQRRRSRGAGAAGASCWRRCRCPPCSRCIRARTRGWRRPACAARLERREGLQLLAAARVPRLPRAAAPLGRGADRLGRRAEGGLPARGAVRHAARDDGVDRDRRRSAGTGWWTSIGNGSSRRSPICSHPPRIPTCMAAAGPERRSWRQSGAGRQTEQRPEPGDRSLNCCAVEHAAESHCVGVVGLGYVGLPLAVAFAQAGSRVVGLDSDSRRVEAIRAAQSYVEDVPGRATSSGRCRPAC